MTEKLFDFSIDQEWNYENGFYITSHITRISKMVAHYELYKSIIDLPGYVVECGVFKGASLIRFATFREMLENQYSRKIIGFDAFGDFPISGDEMDSKFIKEFVENSGDGISVNELNKVFKHKSFLNYELIQGDMLNTVPDYAVNHPELKIALLHIDVDVYEPTKVILNSFFDKVVKGGLIILDDYGTVAGETRAVDEFFNKKEVIKKLPISHIPAYVRKQ